MKVGRVVPGSLDASRSIIKYSWPVVAVDPGKSFVLKGWGAFALKRINKMQTRLIIRTHGWELPSLLSRLVYFVMMPLHYIMERRMLMGIKARAEVGPGVQLSSIWDMLWFLGIILSGIGIAVMVFVGRGIKSVLLPAIYGATWLWPLLIFHPQPLTGLPLLLICNAKKKDASA
jgi:hypothetical protein